MKIAFIIYSYLICRHLLSITAYHILLFERINVLHSPTDIIVYSLFKLVHNFSMFFGFFSFALSICNFQTFSKVFMSGL